MYHIAGSCTKCGAPYYIPSYHMSILPPQPMPSCLCWNTAKITVTSGTSTEPVDQKLNLKCED